MWFKPLQELVGDIVDYNAATANDSDCSEDLELGNLYYKAAVAAAA